MDNQEIRAFISTLTYDCDTVRCLQNYGRIRETISIVDGILGQIRLFRKRINEGPYDLKNIFPEDFWDNKFSGNITFGDMRSNIEEAYKKEKLSAQEDLEKIKYMFFVSELITWIEDNIFRLEDKIKSPQQRKMEFIFGIISCVVIILCMGVVIILGCFSKNWGLKADFYKGKNFEKLVSTGYSKIINFGNVGEMSFKLPLDNFSVRWKGILVVPKDGEYSFFIVSDDGARLFIDRNIIVDAWQDQNPSEHSKTIFLKKGDHIINLDYYNHLGAATLKLSWKYEGVKKEIIPMWNLK